MRLMCGGWLAECLVTLDWAADVEAVEDEDNSGGGSVDGKCVTQSRWCHCGFLF